MYAAEIQCGVFLESISLVLLTFEAGVEETKAVAISHSCKNGPDTERLMYNRRLNDKSVPELIQGRTLGIAGAEAQLPLGWHSASASRAAASRAQSLPDFKRERERDESFFA